MGLIIMHKAKISLSGPEYFRHWCYLNWGGGGGGGGGCPGILTQIQGLLSTCPGIGPL